MKTKVEQNDAFAALPVKAKHVDPLIQLADGMVDIGIVNGGTSPGRTVLHFISAYVCHPFRCSANNKSHFRRLQVCNCKLSHIDQPFTQKCGIPLNGAEICIKGGGRGQQRTSVGMGGRKKNLIPGDAGLLFDGFSEILSLIRIDAYTVYTYKDYPCIPAGQCKGRGLQIIQNAAGEPGNIVACHSDTQHGIDIYPAVANLKCMYCSFLLL